MIVSQRRVAAVAAVVAVVVTACGGGNVGWRSDVGAVEAAGAVVVGEVAVVPAAVDGDEASGVLVGLDVDSGDERWRWTAPDRLVTPPRLATAGELVAVLVPTRSPTQLCAVHAGDGVEHWCVDVDSQALGRGWPTWAQLAGDADQVVVTGADGVVRSFATADGTLRWEHGLETPPAGEDRVVPGDVVVRDGVVVVGSGGAITGLDADTGEPLWETSSPLGVVLRHRLTAGDGDVIVQRVDRIQRLDLVTGEPHWEATLPPPPTGSYTDAVARPVVVGDLVLALPLGTWAFPRESGVLVALDRETGEVRWDLIDDTPPLAPAHVDEILAGLGEVDGAPALLGEDLTVLDPADGAVRTSVELGLGWGQHLAQASGTVIAVDPDGRVVAATPGG